MFGRRRVKPGLPPEWSGASGRSVLKGMREPGVCGFRPRAAKRTTVPDPGAPHGPTWSAGGPARPSPPPCCAGGITCLKTGEGWPCLAPVADPSIRTVAGRSLSARMAAGTCVSALETAKRRGYVAGGAVFRSDRGPQCTGAALAGWAAADGARPSAGRTGCRRDNAVAESLWAGLKKEACHRRTFETRGEAEMACIDWTERSCNRSRPHSAIGYGHPADPMAEFQNRMEAMFKEENYLAA